MIHMNHEFKEVVFQEPSVLALGQKRLTFSTKRFFKSGNLRCKQAFLRQSFKRSATQINIVFFTTFNGRVNFLYNFLNVPSTIPNILENQKCDLM